MELRLGISICIDLFQIFRKRLDELRIPVGSRQSITVRRKQILLYVLNLYAMHYVVVENILSRSWSTK